MAVPYQILVTGDADLQPIIDQVFAEVDQIYNNWNPSSEVSTLNQLPAQTKIKLSDDMERFLHRVAALVVRTDGAFDPTIGFWNQIHFEQGEFWKDDEITLDFGGCAKGYCVDLLVERLREAGYTDLFVNWGGDIRAEGHHPSGRPWRVAIRGRNHLIDLTGAIATSGHEEQQKNGLSHIYNPKTQKQLEATSRTVTIQAKTCFEADALATALSVDPTLTAEKFWIYD